jgi:hypothetical protein
VFRFIFKLVRLGLMAALGTAIVAKFMLKSNAQPTTQEVDMVAIFEGEDLTSTADPFYGGKVLTMFGGTRLDLRQVTPAPTGIHLDLAIVFGGLDLTVPVGWKVDDLTATDSSADVTVVHIGGFVAFGGVRVGNKAAGEVISA